MAGATEAYVGNGAVLKAANVSLLADSTNNADATQDSFGLSLLGSVKLNPTATDQHSVEAYVGAGSNVTSTGTLNLSATSTDNADASANGTQGSLIGLADVDPKAIVEGATTAQIDGTVKAANLSVTATATPDAQSTASVLSIGLGGGASADADAEDHGNTLAELEQLRPA